MNTESAIGDSLAIVVDVDGHRPLPELTAALQAACDRVEERRRTVLVIRLRSMRAESREWPGRAAIRDVNRWERALRRVENLEVMTVVLATGVVGGPALEILLTADFRLADPRMRLLPPVNDGHFWPGMGVYRLVQHLGLARARQIVLWGDDIPVDRLRDVGLVDQVTDDPDEAVTTATVLMGRISDKELAIRRRLLSDAASAPYEDALGVHLAACDRELRRLGGDADGAAGDREVGG